MVPVESELVGLERMSVSASFVSKERASLVGASKDLIVQRHLFDWSFPAGHATTWNLSHSRIVILHNSAYVISFNRSLFSWFLV